MARLRRNLSFATVLAGALLVSGCGAVISRVSADLADNLSTAILNQNDPELVREALPSYLLLLDSLNGPDSENAATLSAAAQLYAAYGAALVSDYDRAKILTTQARDYGVRALCASEEDTCGIDTLPYSDYETVIAGLGSDNRDALYSYSLSTLAWIRAHSDDFKALAALPKVELALKRVMALQPGKLAPSTSMYLGILNTLRPASLGGRPEEGRDWFLRGIELSDGKDLGIKVEYARSYARLIYDRDLHDRLLNEVLAADVQQPGLTLFNQLARIQAQELLDSADNYF
ncbi:MAG: hypothetical protein HKN56_01250 [Gammaproteobacteria bacterium]|nr:TRAP transporter TatT component family protein [Gammaproteobacteria bacterium]NND53581.1 hypothetical protein [Gammaproteobacteria bacterium]